MAEVLSQKLKSDLNDQKDRFPKQEVVVVGYTANYAVYVHEDLEANHPNGGQAKYLEQPAREMQKQFSEIVLKAMQGGASMLQGLLLAGLALQRASQQLVPVDTGNLKNSAFTRKDT